MKIKKLLHIGFGKTGTSKFQKDVFPELCKKIDFLYVGDEEKSSSKEVLDIKHNLTNHVFKVMLGKQAGKITIPDNCFISWEELSSYRDANLIDEFAQKNCEAFGKDTPILLTIREPREWLSSVYLQLCMHETPLQQPEHFFLSDNHYSERLPNVKFNISKFSYKNTIKSYTDRFENVFVVKYESLNSLEFLKKIFDLSETNTLFLKKKLDYRRINRSFSKNSVYLRSKLGKFWNNFGFEHIHKYSNKLMLERSSNNFIKENNNMIKKQNKLKIFHFKNVYQKFINNIFKYEKFQLDFEKLKQIPIKKLEDEYSDIKSFNFFIKK